MRGPFALQAEIVRRGNDAASEMMVPEPIHHYTSEQLSSAILSVRHPIGERATPVRRARARRRFFLPMLFSLRRAFENLQKTLRRHLSLLTRIASFEKMGRR